MSQDFFQCLVCHSLFENVWKVEKHIKQHQNDNVNEDSTRNGGSRRGMLPIKKMTFADCYIPVVKNQIDPNFLTQYSEVQPKDEPVIKQEDDVVSDLLSLKYDDGDGNNELTDNLQEEVVQKLRRSTRRAVANIRRAAAVLRIPDQQEQDDDMEFIEDLLAKLPDEEDDDEFKPPTYISQKYTTTKRKVGRPVGSRVKKVKKAVINVPPKPTRTKKRKRKGKDTDDIEKWHPCEYCSESFPLKNTLYAHLYENHQNEANMITCPVKPCERPFLNFLSLRYHLQLHNDAERKEYALLEQVENRSKSANATEGNDQTPDKQTPNFSSVPCKFCLEKFGSLQQLQDHFAKVHNESSILACPCCGKDISEDGVIRFIGHIKGFHPERMDPFNERANEREHRMKGKRFKCDKCDITYTWKSQLKKHLDSHEEIDMKKAKEENDPERRFSCPVCQKKFKFKDNLRRHFTLHLENNPFVCNFPGCNRKFNSDYNLRRHRVLHSETVALAQRVHCPLCDASFSRKDKLPRHFREVHKPNDVGAPSTTAGVKKRKYQCRLPHCTRIRKFATYKDLESGDNNTNPELTPATARPSTCSQTNEGDNAFLSVKKEEVESVAVMEEIHLVDQILLGSDGNAIHVKGEQLTPEEVSTYFTPKPKVRGLKQTAVTSQSDPEINMTSLTKLITSDPLYERLAKEDPNKIKDIVTANYNYKMTTFTCHMCEAVFSRAWTLQLHLKTQHNTTIMDQKQSATESSDGATAGGQKVTLMCGECAYPAKNAKELARHIKLTHKPKLKCHRCGLFFDCARRLNRHFQQIHDGVRNFNCRYCPQAFTNRHYLRTHERRVHENSDKPTVKKRCPIEGCNRMLAPSTFFKHVKGHNVETDIKREKDHKCMLCGDVLCNAMSLRRHIDAIHLGKQINNRKKGQGLKEAGPPPNGIPVRRGSKVAGDEWFQSLLEKALGDDKGKEGDQPETTDTSAIKERDSLQETGEENGDDLVSILGF